MNRKLIALTGVKGSGKSTLSEYLVTLGYHELTFAEPLKQLIITQFGIDSKWVYDSALKEVVIPNLGVSGRDLCQVIGTECFRDTLSRALPKLTLRGASIWIHTLLSELDKFPDMDIIVSDCRFQDEYDALHQAGFTVFEVTRGLCATSHASEQGCPNDGIIENLGNREDLWRNGHFKIEKIRPLVEAPTQP